MTEAVVVSELEAQLAAVDPRDFNRPALPLVFEEYQAFVASGRYPYIDSVVQEIAGKYGIKIEGRTSPLSHEVYLASGQYEVGRMVARDAELRADGFVPITELVPALGMRIRRPDGKVYRLVPADGDWVLLAPRARTSGVSLSRLVQAHRAYLQAVEEQQTRMNGPAVQMFQPVGSS